MKVLACLWLGASLLEFQLRSREIIRTGTEKLVHQKEVKFFLRKKTQTKNKEPNFNSVGQSENSLPLQQQKKGQFKYQT
jgi:hypothetical protein